MQGDLACGVQVDPATAAASMQYQGNTYYFCSEARLRRLLQDPQRVRGPEESSMNDTTRTVLIALGVALLVAILLPVLFMSGMMGAMMGVGMMGGGGAWVMLSLVGLVLVAGVALLAAGLRR